MTPIEGLHDVLNTLRRQHRRRLALEGIGALVIAVAAALVFGAILTRTLGVTGTGVWTVRVLGYSLVLAAAFWWLLRPLIRRASDAEFAHYVEARAPGLRQALLTAVEHGSDTQRSSALSTRVVESAVRQLRPIAAARSIESAPERKAVRTLGVAAALLIAAIALGPSQVRDAARVLFAPWSVAIAATPPAPIVNVEPGDITVPRGGALDVRAALEHFSADGAELVFKTDSAQEWIRLPMGRDAESFVSRLFDITAPSQYYVEASGIRSRTHRIRVADLPAVQRIAIELRFPAYTGRLPERDEDGGDVAAMKGTTVIVEPTLTRPVREGTLTFDDGTTVPLTLGADGKLSGRFEVRANGFYRVDLVSEEGRRVVGGVQYAIEALEDRPPSVRIETPGRDTKVGALDEVTIEAVASDDYGVRGLELRYRVNGGAEQSVTLRAATSVARAETQGAHTLMLEDIELKPGDLIAYNAAARDGAGQEALSDIYFLEIRPFTRDYRQAESGPQGGGMGQGEESAGDFVQRQKEIVAGTYNWVRDSARKSERERNEDLTTLAIAQGRLKDEVSRLAAQMLARGVTNSDSTFAFIQSTLDSAAILMREAEERLGKREGRRALPPEERALAYVQRADAAYREVQLQAQQQGGGGGGGGGQQSNAEDLADLFELETDRMRNQYESVQQQAQASQTRQVDETLERLRQLASRQQQENERLQRQAEAMRERMGRQTAGGGGGSQRELARQAEEEARRLERLSRERQSPELADAAQQMQRAADAMRRSATGSESDGAQALEQLERAARQVEDAQSRGLTDNVRDLAERARDLEQRQARIADGVRQSLRAAGVERAQQQNRLNEEKSRLAEDVERLEADADRLSREARRDQPESASGLREAADGIRDQRVRDKIQFSRSVMRSGSPEYANTFEEQIGENLAEASEKLRGAVSALRDESAARQQERTREQARALVQGVESLGERLGGEQGGEQGQSGEPGQQGQQGQGQQGQGQQGQEGQQGQRGQGGQSGSPQREGAAQPGGAPPGRPSNQISPNDARQFAREFGLRRQAAEQLRDLARAQDVDVGELDRAIRDLRRLESERGLTDVRTSAALQAEVLERLKTFEFSLNRQLSPDAERRGALGARSPVPSEYRAEVEEYYRSLARPRP